MSGLGFANFAICSPPWTWIVSGRSDGGINCVRSESKVPVSYLGNEGGCCDGIRRDVGVEVRDGSLMENVNVDVAASEG